MKEDRDIDSLWDKIFSYASFTRRFFVTLFVVVILSSLVIYSERQFLISLSSDTLLLFNTLIQAAILVLGVTASYFAFRQLLESRFDRLDDRAMQHLKVKDYKRAIKLWKEAYNIKPDFSVLSNLLETYLIVGYPEGFDREITALKTVWGLKNKILTGPRDQAVILFLEAMRELLVKNIGEAESKITEVINVVEENLSGAEKVLLWDFSDMEESEEYKKLSGEAKIIGSNLIKYLSKMLNEEQREKFIKGNYAFAD